jgi:ribosome-associated protein
LQEISSYKFASIIARIADNRLASDISILNISNVSSLADYFVILSGDTTVQVKTLTSSIKEQIKDLFLRYPCGEEADKKNRWNLLDYGDVVVHVLHKEERETYAIEKFWNHACKIDEENWTSESAEFADKLK